MRASPSSGVPTACLERLDARARRRATSALWEPNMPSPKKSSPAAKPFPKRTPNADKGKSPSELIDARIGELQDWRGSVLAEVRSVIKRADPRITEQWKWNVPVWSCNGIICTGETYKKTVKLTFAKGASLADPFRLFNSSLDGNARRAIDISEGGMLDAVAIAKLICAAVALNNSSTGSESTSAT